MRRLNTLHKHEKNPQKKDTVPTNTMSHASSSAIGITKLKIPITYEFKDEIFSAKSILFPELEFKDQNLGKVTFEIKNAIQKKFDNKEVDLEIFNSTDYDILIIDVKEI